MVFEASRGGFTAVARDRAVRLGFPLRAMMDAVPLWTSRFPQFAVDGVTGGSGFLAHEDPGCPDLVLSGVEVGPSRVDPLLGFLGSSDPLLALCWCTSRAGVYVHPLRRLQYLVADVEGVAFAVNAPGALSVVDAEMSLARVMVGVEALTCDVGEVAPAVAEWGRGVLAVHTGWVDALRARAADGLGGVRVPGPGEGVLVEVKLGRLGAVLAGDARVVVTGRRSLPGRRVAGSLCVWTWCWRNGCSTSSGSLCWGVSGR